MGVLSVPPQRECVVSLCKTHCLVLVSTQEDLCVILLKEGAALQNIYM